MLPFFGLLDDSRQSLQHMISVGMRTNVLLTEDICIRFALIHQILSLKFSL